MTGTKANLKLTKEIAYKVLSMKKRFLLLKHLNENTKKQGQLFKNHTFGCKKENHIVENKMYKIALIICMYFEYRKSKIEYYFKTNTEKITFLFQY